MNADSPTVAIGMFRQMMGDMELLSPSFGNVVSELQLLTTSVNPIRLKNNPVALDDTAIRLLYKKIIR
jgi:hypothetical protein